MLQKVLPLVCAAVGALVSAGCVSSWPIEPGDPVVLGPDEGLLVVHVRTNRPLRSIHISGVQAAEDMPKGTHVRLIGITSGSYRWTEVELSEGVLRDPVSITAAAGNRINQSFSGSVRGFQFRDAERLRFRVEPGVINYVGMVDIQRSGSFSLWMNTIDRTAMGLEELRKRYPDLAAKYPIVYSGPARHVFLGRYLDAAAKNGGGDEAKGDEVR